MSALKSLTGTIVLAVSLLASHLVAQQGATKPKPLNQIIEQFEQDKPAFNGEHWQLIEMEHRPYVASDLQNTLNGLKVPGNRPKLSPVVRIPLEGDEVVKSMVKQVLDIGVMGVIVPHIESKDQVLSLVRAMRYPPQRGQKHPEPRGVRGWGLVAQPGVWGLTNPEYGMKADVWPLNPDGELLALVMIESARGVKNIDEIMAVPGLGGILIGPSDMSMDMGVGKGPGLADPTAPEVEAATQVLAKKCVAKRLLCGTYQSPDPKLRIEQGFRLFPGQNPYRAGATR